MKFKLITLILLMSVSTNCKKIEEKNSEEKGSSFFVGTYTDGDSEGIYKYELSASGKLKKIGLLAESVNPSFLAKSQDGQFLIAVNEISNQDSQGTLESYKIAGDSLSLLSSSLSGGAHPCFVGIDKEGYVLTANYTGGNIGLLQLDGSGMLSGLLDVQQHSGSGSHPRQDAPHAHSAWFSPDGKTIISVDLGTNELWISEIDKKKNKFSHDKGVKLAMDEGAGPRHLTFHPNGKWIYVLNELSGSISQVISNDSGEFQKTSPISTLPAGYSAPNTCADIHISGSGKYLYASNRGHNSIAIFKVAPDDGSLSLLEHESTKGDSPRNFTLSPDEKFLLVANQISNNIVSFKRDPITGLLEFVDEIAAPAPVCLLF